MDAEQPKSLPKIRTFAKDQARVQHHDEPAVAAPVVAAPKEPESIRIIEKKTLVVPMEHIIVKSETVSPPAPVAAHIPAFHELKKKKAPEMITPTPISAPAKHIAPMEKKILVRAKKFDQVKTTSGGTIITDNKKGEFKLIPSAIAAFKAWMKELIADSNKTPKYTITSTDRRKGVIQKATSNTATIFTADNDTLREEIKRRQLQTAEESERELTWTPNTEVGLALLQEKTLPVATPMPVSVVFKKQSGQLPPPVLTQPTPTVVTAPTARVFVPPAEVTNFGKEESLPARRPTYVREPIQPIAPITPPPIVPAPEYIVPHIVEPQPVSETSAVVKIPNTPNPKTSRLKNGLRTLAGFNTNLATIVLVGSIVSLVLLILIVRTFLGLISPTTISNTSPEDVPTLLEEGEVQTLALSSVSKEAFYSALSSKPVPASGVVEFNIVTANGVSVPPQDVLTLLNFNTDQNLNQSVTAVRLAYAASRRAIILEVTDATTVFGALLKWEDTMAQDLASTFSTGGLSQVVFTDKTIGQTDVRILSDNGTPVLVYGFIDKNVVVITQDLAAFTALLPTAP